MTLKTIIIIIIIIIVNYSPKLGGCGGTVVKL